ncbi:MAG: metal-dependent transcriptional regulator [Methanomicrobiales archaeon]|nr:metal-dependent transcriptional regulator [Methanomicrobiales archaeon]
MQTSLREDILEAILCLAGEGGKPVSVAEIAAQIRSRPRTLEPVLSEMVRDGEVTVEGGSASLTGPGLERARGVAHRHQVLQCFLSERLGIDGPSADQEACRLEHQVSDETIDRLTDMMGEEAVAGGGKARPLPEFGEGDVVRVQLIRGSGALDRLLDLGILPGEELEVRRTLPNGAVVLLVKGCDIALSPEIAGSILAVERV